VTDDLIEITRLGDPVIVLLDAATGRRVEWWCDWAWED